MHKTVTITLNGIIFNIEEGAYKTLDEYLSSIKEHFLASDDKEEILTDIESSIADKFSEKISAKEQVITQKDVDQLIKVMGTVQDIAEEADADILIKEKIKTKEKKTKKLYRNPDDVIIAGVCSGIATYFNIDPVIIRLIFVVTIFFGGSGILAYLILWLVMPEAKTGAQKLEMQGSPVTIKKLEENVKKKIKVASQEGSGVLKKIVSWPFKILEAIFKGLKVFFSNLLPIFSIFIGIILVIAMIAAIFSLTLSLGVLLFNIDSPYVISELPIQELLDTTPYYLAIIAVYLVTTIPLIFILLLGITMCKRKSTFKAVTNSILLGIWMLAIIVSGVIAIDAAPQFEGKISEFIANEEKISQTYDLKDFDSLLAQGGHTVNIAAGEEYSIVATGRQRDLEKLELEIADGQLTIAKKPLGDFCIICFNRPVQIEITMPKLNDLTTSGATQSTVIGFTADDFTLGLSGASKSDLEIELENSLSLNLSGASKANLTGSAKAMTAKASGASKITAFDFPVKEAELDLSGASQAEVNAAANLEIEASGASKVYYLGEPQLNSQLSGTSKLINK